MMESIADGIQKRGTREYVKHLTFSANTFDDERLLTTLLEVVQHGGYIVAKSARCYTKYKITKKGRR